MIHAVGILEDLVVVSVKDFEEDMIDDLAGMSTSYPNRAYAEQTGAKYV